MTHHRRFLHLVVCALVLLGSTRSEAALGHLALLGHLDISTAVRITTVWGYSDAAAGKEYALVGDWGGGFYIVDVTNPAAPTLASKAFGVPGYDLRPYGHYVYTCDGDSAGTDSRVVDISKPKTPTVLPQGFKSCHSLSISPGGLLFAEYSGVRIYDLSADPTAPLLRSHIVNQGYGSTPRGSRLYDFNGDSLYIWDVSNPASPSRIGGAGDPGVGIYGSGDESQDHGYLYVCDPSAVTPTPDIVIYDISNPASPARVGDINDPTSRAHQVYVSGNLMFVGYNTAGVKVFDITNPASPVLADQYDTSPYQAETGADAYSGVFDAFPYAPTGIVYVADHPTGLYLFAVEGFTTPTGVRPAPAIASLAQNYPNPFNPSTTIEFALASRSRARLRVFDVRGTLVRTLLDGTLSAGSHAASWDGIDDGGGAVASGVYYYRLDAGASSATRRMVLLK